MLVLGRAQGRWFVIHNLYGIRGRDERGDLIRRVGRVVVSDLSLGAESRMGSLADRMEAGLRLRSRVDKDAGPRY